MEDTVKLALEWLKTEHIGVKGRIIDFVMNFHQCYPEFVTLKKKCLLKLSVHNLVLVIIIVCHIFKIVEK